MDNSNAILPHSGAAETLGGTSTATTCDVLRRAERRALDAARYRIGSYSLREPDYRQILRWAEASGMAAEEVMERLAGSSVRFAHEEPPIGFVVENGAMDSVAWDFGVFPFVPDNWEAGLVIRTLGFEGQWPDVAIALRPRLPSLRALCCRGIGLEWLDLSQVLGLTWLNCDNNNLSELDLSPVPLLTTLHCSGNNLTELDLSPVRCLTELDCGESALRELDLSPVPRLTKLYCWNNDELTELDLSPVSNLTWLECSRNNNLSELDLSPVPRLTTLHCAGNNFTELDLAPVPGLIELDCGDSAVRELDLSPVPRLTKLYCWDNELTELDLSPVPGLTKLWADEGLQLQNIPAGLEVNPNYPEFLSLDQR
jgi:hypothetical protein